MTPLETGGIVAVVMILGKIISALINKISPSKDKGIEEKSIQVTENAKNIAVMCQRLLTIETNHLVHIQKDLDKNSIDNESMKAQMVGLSTKIDFIVEHIKQNKTLSE